MFRSLGVTPDPAETPCAKTPFSWFLSKQSSRPPKTCKFPGCLPLQSFPGTICQGLSRCWSSKLFLMEPSPRCLLCSARSSEPLRLESFEPRSSFFVRHLCSPRHLQCRPSWRASQTEADAARCTQRHGHSYLGMPSLACPAWWCSSATLL